MICLRKKGKEVMRALKYNRIEQKLYYGQRGILNFSLSKRTYDFTLQTIWEDYCQLSLEGLTGENKYTIYEEEDNAYLDDSCLNDNLQQRIRLHFKLPLHYGLLGKVRGSIQHTAHGVSAELQSEDYDIEIIGEGHSLQLGKVEAENARLVNEGGGVDIKGITCSNGIVKAKQFASSKVMCPQLLTIETQQRVDIRSAIFTGLNQQRIIHSKHVTIDTLSGQTKIVCDRLALKHLYAGHNQIDISCQEISCTIGKGTGKIRFPVGVPLEEETVRQSIVLNDKNLGVMRYRVEDNVVHIE